MIESGSVLSAWESFYVIVGSSGGALIGLQFVVITLIADRRPVTSPGSVAAFGTPTVVHLTMALIVSAIMSAPWKSLEPVSMVLAICGVAGLLYGAIVIRRALRQTTYQPVLEDWIWHAVLPCTTYAAVAGAAGLLRRDATLGLFAVAASALLLLLIGIHNAWDTVTHIVITQERSKEQ